MDIYKLPKDKTLDEFMVKLNKEFESDLGHNYVPIPKDMEINQSAGGKLILELLDIEPFEGIKVHKTRTDTFIISIW